MPPRAFPLALVLAALGAATSAPARAQETDLPRPGTYPAAYDSAAVAWHAGRYPEALARLDALLAGPGAARVLEPAALLTGELYRTTEVAPDGYEVRWSPDGRFAAFETGSGGARATRLVAVTAEGTRPAATLAGTGLVFSPDGRAVAYLAVPRSPALDSTRAALAREEQAPLTQESIDRWNALQKTLAGLEADAARIVVRDLASGRERGLAVRGLRRWALAWGGDGRTLVLVGSPTGSAARDLYALPLAGGAPRRLTRGAAVPTGTPVHVTPVGTLVYAATDSTVAVVRPGEPLRILPGAMPALTPDGRRLAYVTREGGDHRLVVVALDAGAPRPLYAYRAPHDMANPALSADGRRVVFQMMPREDWELYVADVRGTATDSLAGDSAAAAPRRLTNEIQHDVFPRFVDSTRVLAAIGESRHRRSYLYDVRTGARTRLFHNNTVRTVAPEYEWAVSPDGTRVLIRSERDGDTISPENGVYLTDLTRRVTVAEVRERIRAQLAAERALRAYGDTLFAPVADAVRPAVADVSVARVYGYARDLFALGSKYIGTPGNRQAIDYLVATLRSFGYEPEVQWFDAEGKRTANVVATLRGTANPDQVYVASSHFDSVEEGPGSDDNTSGTTALLEAARVLARRPQAATIRFAWFTGEEAGLYGSREFVRRAQADGAHVVGALNNDMLGFANDDRPDDTIRYSNAGLRDLQHAAAFLFTGLITYDAKYYKYTDAQAYYDAYGDIVAGIGSYPILGNPHYHQASDVLETVDQRLVAEVSRTTVASLVRMAAGPARLGGLRAVRRGATVEASWTPAAERGVTGYEIEYGPAGGKRRLVTEPRVALSGVPAGAEVRVRAVLPGGLVGWDWARVKVE